MVRTVATVLPEGVELFELGVTIEVFGTPRHDLAEGWYDFKLVAAGPAPVTTAAGFTIDTPYGLEDLSGVDRIIVPPILDGPYPAELLDALVREHERGAEIVSICTGAFALAEAGLLEGRRATTHWRRVTELQKYPGIEVDPNVLYIDEDGIATSAGAASGIDLCLHLVRKDHGAEVANSLARRLVVPPHRDGGQAQYIEQPIASPPDADLLNETLDWARANAADPITVEDMARQAAMSPRTFARRFRETTGTTPHQWLVLERVRLAQRMLETTDATIDWIAVDSGFGTATNMRLHFRRVVGVPPGTYRTSFRTSRVA